ncbi:MAG: hypothetical protein ABII10_00035 [Candidatus Paceibacterota bacterium]
MPSIQEALTLPDQSRAFDSLLKRELEIFVSKESKKEVPFASLEIGETVYSPKLGLLTVINKINRDGATLTAPDGSIEVRVNSRLTVQSIDW